MSFSNQEAYTQGKTLDKKIADLKNNYAINILYI